MKVNLFKASKAVCSKVILSFSAMLALSQLASAQQYVCTTNTPIANTIPFSNSTSNFRQLVYYPSDFPGAPSGSITDIYVKASTAVTPSFANLTVKMGPTTLNTFTSTYVTGLQTVYTGAYSQASVAGNYVKITLQTPYVYDNTQNLIIEFSQTGQSPGFSVNQGSVGYAGRSVFGGANATSGSVQDRLADLGFDILTAPCTNPPVIGTLSASPSSLPCPNSSVTLTLAGASPSLGQSFTWQSSTDNITYTNIGTPTPSPTISVTPMSTTWYRCQVVCSGGTPVTSNAIQVTIGSGGLAGTYTINAGQPTAGTNFNSFTDAVNALACGITAPVIFNVTPGSGPYNEQVSFGNVPGTSAINTIKVNGNGNIVQFNTTSGSNLPLLQLDGTQHLTVDNLNFKTLSTTAAWAALITGGAEHDSIINCSFDLSSVPSTASASNSGIVFSGSNTSAIGTGNSGKHITIANNHLIGSNLAGGLYYGISLNANADSNYIVNNVVENYYYYGIYLAANVGNHIIGNEITRPNKTTGFTTNYCIYLASGTASQGHRIERNRIHSNTAPNATSTSVMYGIGILADPPATNPIIVANNVIYNMKGGTLYGIYTSTATNTKFYHNTISFNLPTGSSNANYGLYATGTNTGTDFVNNNISITAGGTGVKYGFYYSTAASVSDAQKNNIYLNSSLAGAQNYGYYATAYATQAAFQTAYPALEVGSPTADPAFISLATGDLNPSNPAILTAGNNLLADVPTDINGIARSTTPTLGAFELAIIGINNARSFSIISPSGNFCNGNNPTRVVVGNVGTNDITSMQIHWSVNGVAQPVFNYTGTLVPIGSPSGQSMDTVLLGNANLNAGTNTIVVYTALPNGVADPQPNDDTVSITATPATFAVSVSSPVICANEQSVLSLTPNSGYADGDIEWEYSTNGTTWTSIPNSDTVNYVVTNIGTTTHYRARILSSGQNCVSPMATVDVNYIPPPTFVEDESCVPGVTLNISATPASGTTLKWYEDLTTTTVFSTANNITTIPLFATKTYYAASVSATGCESVRTPVNATIHVLPPVNLGFDLDTCVSGSGTVTLDPGPQHPGATYLWDDNSTAPTRGVTQSGVYSVTVTDTNTCSFADTITVNISPRPEIDLAANGTGFCNGALLTLDAGPDGENGGSYYWNNGATTRTIDITASGTYTVSVTSPAGCLGTDTVDITVDGFAPTTNGIHVTPLSTDSFNFTAINPQNVDNYEWDFGDGSPVSISSNPTHKFAGNGQFLVQMRSISSCAEKIDSAYVNIVGLNVNDLNEALNAIQIYPNPNSNGQLNINSGKDVELKSIVFVNIIGQTVHTVNNLVKGQEIHQITIPVHLANGMYVLKVDTDKGMINKKVELNR